MTRDAGNDKRGFNIVLCWAVARLLRKVKRVYIGMGIYSNVLLLVRSMSVTMLG